MALQELGRHMDDCPFIGYTMRLCIKGLTEKVRNCAALMPKPTYHKAAKRVSSLMREARAALDAMDGRAELLQNDFDVGMMLGDGATAIGSAIESLSMKAGMAIESAAASNGADIQMFCFYAPPKKKRAAA